MFRVYACLTQRHDLYLVVVAAALCLFAAFTTLNLIQRARAADGHWRRIWLGTGTLTAAGGIWATHFVAVLAFDTGLPTSYDPVLTLASIVVAAAVTGIGFSCVRWQSQGAGPWLGGAVVGAGISAMHYTGMAGLLVPAEKSWEPGLVVASVMIGIGLSATALRTVFASEHLGRRVAGAALLALAICAMHFTAMAALRLTPSPLIPIPESGMSPQWLAHLVAITTAVILGFSLTGSLFDQHLARLKMREADRLQRLVNAAVEGIGIHKDGRLLDANVALAKILGCDPQTIIDAAIEAFAEPAARGALRAHIVADSEEPLEINLVRQDATLVPVQVFGRSIEYRGEQARVAVVRDMSERKRAEARIRHLAHHDTLTDLPNRLLFRDRLGQALARAQRTHEGAAVLTLDLDRFKHINEAHGPAAGDEVLRRVAVRLRAVTRDMDTVARLGGDEFAIIQPGLKQPQAAAMLAERLLTALGESIDRLGAAGSISASIGIALYPGDADTPDALLQRADLALYRAKADGGAGIRLFEREMDAELRARRALEQDLRRAFAAGELAVHYQPQSESASGAIVGFEALARWPRSERDAVPPSTFIPLAEESGLILPLGEWVLRTACTEAACWPANFRLSVNLSPVQFRKGDLPTLVARILQDTGLPGNRLELEITEGIWIDDHERAMTVLRRLKALGVRISMDDFGTGYSSLSYLQRFPFDKIKIDQSFVRGLDSSADSLAIVRAVIGLGRSLNVAVIAEGVESEAERAVLRREGCDELQGYLIGRPLPPDEVLALLRDQPKVTPHPTLLRHRARRAQARFRL